MQHLKFYTHSLLSLFFVLLMSFNLQAQDIFVKTTNLNITITPNNEDSFSRSIEMVDGIPTNLVTYDENGTPLNRITINSSKAYKLDEDDALIKLRIEYSTFKKGKWHSQNQSTIINRQDIEGTMSLEGTDQNFYISTKASEGQVLESDIRVLNLNNKKCDLNSSLDISQDNLSISKTMSSVAGGDVV